MLILAALVACSPGTDDGSVQAGEGLEATDADASAQVLFEAVDVSLQELTLCGQAQRGFVMPLALRVLSSSEDLIDDDTYADIQDLASALGIELDPTFAHDGDTTWTIPMAGGQFDVQFLVDAQPIPGDVFRLDSYLKGVTATSSVPINQNTDFEAPIRFEFHWEEEGELAYLLDPLTNPVVVEASVIDLLYLALGNETEADLGSFAGLADIEVEGHVPFNDLKNGIAVAYDGHLSGSVLALSTGQAASVSFEGLDAELNDWQIETTTLDIESFPHSLGGRVDFLIEGPKNAYTVTTDYGDGTGSPTTEWSCAGPSECELPE